jgi:hypothetical protein
MYNFRYLLVTIVSIFVSLAIGLLLGAAIAGSDIVRDTSQDMIDSLMTRFDDINATNNDLRRQLEDDNLLTAQFVDSWAANRLDGRSICVISSATDADTATSDSLRDSVASAGAVVSQVKVLKDNFGLDEAQIKTGLLELLPANANEDYQVTLASALASEWTYSYPYSASAIADSADGADADEAASGEAGEAAEAGEVGEDAPSASASSAPSDSKDLQAAGDLEGSSSSSGLDASSSSSAAQSSQSSQSSTSSKIPDDLPTQADEVIGLTPATPFQKTIYDNYKVTNYLVSLGVIQITCDYHLLLDHKNPELSSEQLAALRACSSWQLPYMVNGVIDTLVWERTPSGSANQEQSKPASYIADRVALELTTIIAEQGADKLLPHPAALRPISAGDSEAAAMNGSYFGLLVQTGDKSQTLASSALDLNLSALVSQVGVTDSYNTIALLSGATRGIYGLDAAGGRFCALPVDKSGLLPFAH